MNRFLIRHPNLDKKLGVYLLPLNRLAVDDYVSERYNKFLREKVPNLAN